MKQHKNVSEPARQFHTPEALAAAICYHPESVRRLIREGRISALKFGNGWRIADPEFERIAREGLPV